MRGRVGQRIDDLQLLDDRAGPPVRDKERQRIIVVRTDVDEMNVQPVDIGRELRQGVEPRFDLAPVVIGLPIARQFAHCRELHALRCIRHQFLRWPLRRGDPPAQVRNRLIGCTEAEGPNCGVFDSTHRCISQSRGLPCRRLACCGQMSKKQAGGACRRSADKNAAPVRQWRDCRHVHSPGVRVAAVARCEARASSDQERETESIARWCRRYVCIYAGAWTDL